MPNMENLPSPDQGELDILRILDGHKANTSGEAGANMIDGGPNLSGASPTDD